MSLGNLPGIGTAQAQSLAATRESQCAYEGQICFR